MLSRAAEALFWVGRYVERAEDTARLLDVQFHQALEDPGVDQAAACQVLLTVMGSTDEAGGVQELLDRLAYDETNPSSIVGALLAARENARGARESLSAEIWECLNTTHFDLAPRVAAARGFGPAPFFGYVRERAAIVAGLVSATVSRDSGYDFLVLGRSLERVDMTARLLAARVGGAGGTEAWTATLRACSAHEAYLRTYQRGVEARRALEFLLLDRLFPRSVLHALGAGEQALARLDPAARRVGAGGAARRTLGATRAELEFLPAGALLDALPARLRGLQSAVSDISDGVRRQFFAGSTVAPWLEEALR